MKNSFNADEMKAFEPEAKVGLLATVNQDGLPHITLITALQARDEKHMVWGQFSEGLSKQHVQANPKTGFLILTMDRKLWRGKASWTHRDTQGPEYEMFNQKPMFRYNCYTGIHTIHYMDLIAHGGQESLPLLKIALGMLMTRLKRRKTQASEPVMNSWSSDLMAKPATLKFMAWVGDDGYPQIVPVLQAMSAGSNKIVFSPLAYASELKALRPGTAVAVYGLSMQMENVLLRGKFTGYSGLGAIEIDWVYNSMPPLAGQIYPPLELKEVAKF